MDAYQFWLRVPRYGGHPQGEVGFFTGTLHPVCAGLKCELRSGTDVLRAKKSRPCNE